MVVQLAKNEALPAHLPPADKVNLMNRLALLWYQKTP